jgi:hypothetical protein
LSQKLLERDVNVAEIYNKLYCMLIKNNPKGTAGSVTHVIHVVVVVVAAAAAAAAAAAGGVFIFTRFELFIPYIKGDRETRCVYQHPVQGPRFSSGMTLQKSDILSVVSGVANRTNPTPTLHAVTVAGTRAVTCVVTCRPRAEMSLCKLTSREGVSGYLVPSLWITPDTCQCSGRLAPKLRFRARDNAI